MPLNYSEIANKINKEMRDPLLKRILFGAEDVDGSDVRGIEVLYRMMVFSFVFTYAKYKFDKRTKILLDNAKLYQQYKTNLPPEVLGKQKGGTPPIFMDHPNAKRVFESFDCIFNGEDVGLDLIIYILSEIQLDVLNYDKKSYFKDIFVNSDTPLQIPVLRNVIKTWMQSAKHAESNNNKLCEYLAGLYESLEVLRNVEILKDENDEISFRLHPSGEIIPSYGLMRLENGEELYYLASYEIVSNNMACLLYSSSDGGQELKREIPYNEFRKKSFITNNDDIPRPIFAKSLFSIGFKYIKNLSLSVADSITKATKQKFFEHYFHKYSEVFAQLGYRKFNEVNWDNIVTILMFEEGPSELLEFVLDSDGFYFEKILHNLEVRYNDYTIASKTKSLYEFQQAEQMKTMRKYLDDNSSVVKNIISINKTLMAKCIIDALAEIENNKMHSSSQFVENLPMRIRSIDKVIHSNETMESKVIKINKALEKTFRYILPFYHGILAYQKCKEEYISQLDLPKSLGGIKRTDSTRKKMYAACETEFFNAAKTESAAISRMPINLLIERFVKFSETLSVKRGHCTKITQDGKNLKSAIGRAYLCSIDAFQSIISLTDEYGNTPERYMDDDLSLVVKKGETMGSFINRIKHAKPGEPLINIVEFNRFLLCVKKLMYFFIYNEDFEREMILGQQISYDPIYPYVVRYTEKSENRDGYNIDSFSVFYSEDNGDKEVKILSERDYTINEKYYCIPNVSTSNSRWWIEPFLISCKKYDQIIIDNETTEDDTLDSDDLDLLFHSKTDAKVN